MEKSRYASKKNIDFFYKKNIIKNLSGEQKKRGRNMKYLRQFMVIMMISFIGELLHYFIPLPVPASIYGLVLMLVLLETGMLSLENVKETGLFLVAVMPVMFIPPAVGLLDSWKDLKAILVPVALMIVVITFFVMAVSGHVAQFIIRHRKNENEEEQEEEAMEIIKERRSNE